MVILFAPRYPTSQKQRMKCLKRLTYWSDQWLKATLMKVAGICQDSGDINNIASVKHVRKCMSDAVDAVMVGKKFRFDAIQGLVHTTCGVLIPDDMFDAFKKRWVGKHPFALSIKLPRCPASMPKKPKLHNGLRHWFGRRRSYDQTTSTYLTMHWWRHWYAKRESIRR